MTDADTAKTIAAYYDECTAAELGARFGAVNIDRSVHGLPSLNFHQTPLHWQRVFMSLTAGKRSR